MTSPYRGSDNPGWDRPLLDTGERSAGDGARIASIREISGLMDLYNQALAGLLNDFDEGIYFLDEDLRIQF